MVSPVVINLTVHYSPDHTLTLLNRVINGHGELSDWRELHADSGVSLPLFGVRNILKICKILK